MLSDVKPQDYPHALFLGSRAIDVLCIRMSGEKLGWGVRTMGGRKEYQ